MNFSNGMNKRASESTGSTALNVNVDRFVDLQITERLKLALHIWW